MARSTARAAAMQLIYARMASGEGDERTLAELIVPQPPLDDGDKLYMEDIVEGVWRDRAELDAQIGAFSRDWPVARMAWVDLAILRLSAYELANREDVPAAVSINEAVELTHTFSTEESGAFVNGILGSMHRQRAKERGN